MHPTHPHPPLYANVSMRNPRPRKEGSSWNLTQGSSWAWPDAFWMGSLSLMWNYFKKNIDLAATFFLFKKYTLVEIVWLFSLCYPRATDAVSQTNLVHVWFNSSSSFLPRRQTEVLFGWVCLDFLFTLTCLVAFQTAVPESTGSFGFRFSTKHMEIHVLVQANEVK